MKGQRVRIAGAELTRRQVAVLSLICAGHPYKAIARLLGISEHTAKQHAYHIRAAFGGKSWGQIGYAIGRADARREQRG